MTDRPKHPDKELDHVLKSAWAQAWRIVRRGGYFNMYCPCGEHKKTVHLSPSKNYKRNLLGELRRRTCWKESDDG